MNFRLFVISATCLSIVVAPVSSTSLLAAAAAVKGAIIGAGLTALKTSGSSSTVVIQSQPDSVAEVVPANQVIVHDSVHSPVSVQTAQTITYTSSNPLSRLWGAVSNAIAAKTKAIGDILRPNRVVVIVPQTTEKTTTSTTTPKPTTQQPVITIDLEHKPMPSIDVDLGHNPLLPSINVDLGNKPIELPSINVGLGNNPLVLPSIDVDLGLKPLLPSINVDLNHKPLNLPNIEVSASVGRGSSFRRLPVAIVNYLKK